MRFKASLISVVNSIKHNSLSRQVVALIILIGALPFCFTARVQAQEVASIETKENRWLDDYSKPVGFTYGAKAVLNANYLWRGLYAGGLCLQPSANIGYGGLYADLWWSIGANNWAFHEFQPEVDISIGFERWGLNVFLLYIHNFNCGFFDFQNHYDRGNRLEIDARYTVSSKLPLSILWATRVSAADAYISESGDTAFAYSSYLELSYTQHLPYQLSLSGAVGLTPWRSCYTAYKKTWGVCNIDIRLRKDWELTKRLGLMLTGQFSINPFALATDPSSAKWHHANPWDQAINANLAVGVYLK